VQYRVVALALLVALVIVPAGFARFHGGTVNWSVAAPAVGQGSVVAFTATGPRSSPPLLVKVTNLGMLGKGFGGVAIIEKIRGGSEVFLVMFKGNFSAATSAATVKLQISTPSTIKNAPVGSKCKKFADWKAAFAHTSVAKKGTEILQGLIPNGPDKPYVFLTTMISSLGGTC